MRRRRVVLLVAIGALVVFAGLSTVFALQLGDGPADYRGTALLGDPVPALTLPRLDGGSVALADLRGNAVIVNFFNSWCVPCKEEEPSLRAFFRAHRGDAGFEMVGIVRDDTDAAIRKWARERQDEPLWTIAFDPGARASVDFGTTGQPETFAISPDGTVVAVHRGRATIDDLENMLAIAQGRGPAE